MLVGTDENLGEAMTLELTYLALTALLTATLWIPYIVGQVMTNGFLAAENYKDPTPREVPLWAQRCNRAHINAVETFAPFAAIVILIQLAGGSTSTTAFFVAAYFWLRLAHAVIYIIGIPFLRTIVFTLGWLCIVVLFFQLLGAPGTPVAGIHLLQGGVG